MAERRQDLEAVGDGLLDRQRIGPSAVRARRASSSAAQADAVDVLHDDVAVATVLDEVVDLDDVGVLDLGQEPALGEGGGHRVLVAAVEQALEHDPAVGDVAVAGEVDPAQPAVGQAADDLVLTADQVSPRGELGGERERRAAASGRSPRCGPGDRPAAAADGLVAPPAEPAVLGDVGSAITPSPGSRAGTGGMSTSPAPSRLRRTAPVPAETRDRPVGVVDARAAAGTPRISVSLGAAPDGASPHSSQ